MIDICKTHECCMIGPLVDLVLNSHALTSSTLNNLVARLWYITKIDIPAAQHILLAHFW